MLAVHSHCFFLVGATVVSLVALVVVLLPCAASATLDYSSKHLHNILSCFGRGFVAVLGTNLLAECLHSFISNAFRSLFISLIAH